MDPIKLPDHSDNETNLWFNFETLTVSRGKNKKFKKSTNLLNFLKQSVKNCFIRGSVVRYVQLPADEIDTQLLQDAARKEATQGAK